MKQSQIDRLYNIDFFKATAELRDYVPEKIEYGIPLDYPQSSEAVKLVKETENKYNVQIFLLKFRSIAIDEAWEHIDKIIEIFRLIENSIFIERDELIDFVIDRIDEGFKGVGVIKLENFGTFAFEAWGYRSGVIDGIYDVILHNKNERFETIKKQIYKEQLPAKLVDARERYAEVKIDYELKKDHDLCKMLEHITNRLKTLRDQKIFMIKSLVVPNSKFGKREYFKSMGFEYCLNSEGELKTWAEISNYEATNTPEVEPNDQCWLYGTLLRELTNLTDIERKVITTFYKTNVKSSLLKLIRLIRENQSSQAKEVILNLKNKLLLDLSIDTYTKYYYENQNYHFFLEFKPYYIELIDQTLPDIKPASKAVKAGFASPLSRPQIETLYTQLKAPENAFIDAGEGIDNFAAIFNDQTLPENFKSVKWHKSVRLLAYFVMMLNDMSIIYCDTWQSTIEAGALFTRSKKITANDLAVAKNNFESNGNPRGHLKIDAILKTLRG